MSAFGYFGMEYGPDSAAPEEPPGQRSTRLARAPMQNGWHGYLTTVNADAVAERLGLLMRDRFTAVNIRQNAAWRPEMRTSLTLQEPPTVERGTDERGPYVWVRWFDGDYRHVIGTRATEQGNAEARGRPVTIQFRHDYAGEQAWITQITAAGAVWHTVIGREDHEEA